MDPCDASKGDQEFGDGAGDLARALARLPGLTVWGPSESSIDGHPAIAVTLTAPEAMSHCKEWEILGPPDRHWLFPHERNRLWVVELAGGRLLISAETFSDLDTATLKEQIRIVKSIEFLED